MSESKESDESETERVRSPDDMRGFAARSESRTDAPATELLREKREQDRDGRDRHLSEKDG